MNTFGITLSQVRAFLGYTSELGSPGGHSRDPVIQLLLDSAIATLKQLTGRNLEYGLYRDTFQELDQRVYLTEYPATAIISITNGLTLSPVTDYRFFPKDGYIFFQSNFWNYNWASRQRYVESTGGLVTIDYLGGYETLPADMVMAVLNGIQAGDSYQKQISNYGGTVKRISVYDVGVTDLAVPKEGSSTVMVDTMTSQLQPYISEAAGLAGWLLHESEYLGTYGGSPL